MSSSKIPPKLFALAQQLKEAREQASALGLFTDNRDLLKCPSCGLQEDVLISGQLITYDKDQPDADDSTLRFQKSDNGRFICPRCGSAGVFE